MGRQNFQIYKSHGGLEKFSNKKLYTSLRHSGLPHKQSQIITEQVAREVSEGSKTRDIYRKTLKLVNQSSHLAAVHYSLKRALFDLGPSGHNFEAFVAKYFEEIGYQTKTCQTLNGRLVKHEIDVVGTKNGKRVFVECKFHNRVGIKNDIKIALYVKARWDDLKQGYEGKTLSAYYLASNTAFTVDAITYAEGSGLNLLGVNAPVHKPFVEEIKSLHLYPITSLKGLSSKMKRELLLRNIILAKELPAQLSLLQKLGLRESEVEPLLAEIELLNKSIL
jgi:hypothetical protein